MRRGIQVAALLWAGAIVVVATLTGFAQRLHGPLASYFRAEHGMTKAQALEWSQAIQKALHVPAYALLTLLVYLALPPVKRRGLLTLAVVLAVAVVDEVLQGFNPSRTGRATDLLVDLLGAALGLLVARRLARRAARAAGAGPTSAPAGRDAAGP